MINKLLMEVVSIDKRTLGRLRFHVQALPFKEKGTFFKAKVYEGLGLGHIHLVSEEELQKKCDHPNWKTTDYGRVYTCAVCGLTTTKRTLG